MSVRANIASSVVVVAMGSRLAIMTIIRTYYWNSSSFHCGPYTNMKILKSAKNKQTKMIKTSEKRLPISNLKKTLRLRRRENVGRVNQEEARAE